MKKLLSSLALIFIAWTLSGCGKNDTVYTAGQQGPAGAQGVAGQVGATGSQGIQGIPGLDGVGCTVSALPACLNAPNGGALITCANGSTVITNGTNGSNGTNGTNGANGTNGTNSQVTIVADTTNCPTGGYDIILSNGSVTSAPLPVCNGATGANGTNGANGATGASGTNGTNGTNGATGATGAAGQNAPTALALEQFIAPCTNASSPWKEQLLCYNNGQLMADFSATMSGNETRLSFIPAGSYEDTDDSGCNFSVSTDSAGDSVVSWSAGSNQYATWTASSVTCKKSL